MADKEALSASLMAELIDLRRENRRLRSRIKGIDAVTIRSQRLRAYAERRLRVALCGFQERLESVASECGVSVEYRTHGTGWPSPWRVTLLMDAGGHVYAYGDDPATALEEAYAAMDHAPDDALEFKVGGDWAFVDMFGDTPVEPGDTAWISTAEGARRRKVVLDVEMSESSIGRYESVPDAKAFFVDVGQTANHRCYLRDLSKRGWRVVGAPRGG